jgi:peptide chain release factor 1
VCVSGGVFRVDLTDERPGFIAFIAEGEGAKEMFENECGGHRWQALSGKRVHTSTITVAILDLDADNDFKLNEADVELISTRGSGPGGQNRNKVESCIVATHRPSGLSVRIDTRSQYQSRKIALQVLGARLGELDRFKKLINKNEERKNQIGSGMRGDKVRTYRERDDLVMDHRTNKKTSLTHWMKGNW